MVGDGLEKSMSVDLDTLPGIGIDVFIRAIESFINRVYECDAGAEILIQVGKVLSLWWGHAWFGVF